MPPFPSCGNCYNKSSYNPKTGAQLLCFRFLPVGNFTHRHQLLRINHVLVAYGISLYMVFSDYVGMYFFLHWGAQYRSYDIVINDAQKMGHCFLLEIPILSLCTWIYMFPLHLGLYVVHCHSGASYHKHYVYTCMRRRGHNEHSLIQATSRTPCHHKANAKACVAAVLHHPRNIRVFIRKGPSCIRQCTCIPCLEPRKGTSLESSL